MWIEVPVAELQASNPNQDDQDGTFHKDSNADSPCLSNFAAGDHIDIGGATRDSSPGEAFDIFGRVVMMKIFKLEANSDDDEVRFGEGGQLLDDFDYSYDTPDK